MIEENNRIRATGTIHRNRTAKCPLPEEKELRKKEGEAYEIRSTEKVLVIAWNENRVVNVASNVLKCKPLQRCSRYSSKTKETLQPNNDNLSPSNATTSSWVAWIYTIGSWDRISQQSMEKVVVDSLDLRYQHMCCCVMACLS